MTVYVDPLAQRGWKLCGHSTANSHMFTDQVDLTELHALASRIGMRAEWFQDSASAPHYDLTPKRRRAAIEAGAVPVDRRTAVSIWRARRAQNQQENTMEATQQAGTAGESFEDSELDIETQMTGDAGADQQQGTLLACAAAEIRELREICRQWEPDHSSAKHRRTLSLSGDLVQALDAAAAGLAQVGPAFNVSKVGETDRFGGTTYTVKAHFNNRWQAEAARYLLAAEKLPAGPFPAQAADQAESIDLAKLEAALVWHGCATPVSEMMSWWVGREVNRLLDCVLTAKADHQTQQAEAVKSERRAITFGDIVHQQVIAMRAAVVAAELEGPEVGMQWIRNTLFGPGHLPDLEAARALGGAQALFDKETSDHEAFRAKHPAPAVPADLLKAPAIPPKLQAVIDAAQPVHRLVPSASATLQPHDLAALSRFQETAEDDQSFDISKDQVKRLVELGAICNEGFGRYSLTAFGGWVLDVLPRGWPRIPLKTHADHAADAKAAFDAKHRAAALES